MEYLEAGLNWKKEARKTLYIVYMADKLNIRVRSGETEIEVTNAAEGNYFENNKTKELIRAISAEVLSLEEVNRRIRRKDAEDILRSSPLDITNTHTI